MAASIVIAAVSVQTFQELSRDTFVEPEDVELSAAKLLCARKQFAHG